MDGSAPLADGNRLHRQKLKTPDEIKKSLFCCSVNRSCNKCPLFETAPYCINNVMKDALCYIEQLEERIALMLIQMRGDCGCCAYKGRPSYKSPCTECLCSENRPKWEYEGLPDVKEKGDME